MRVLVLDDDEVEMTTFTCNHHSSSAPIVYRGPFHSHHAIITLGSATPWQYVIGSSADVEEHTCTE